MVDEWQFCVIIDAIRSIVSSCTIHVHAGVNSNASFNMTMHKYSRLVVLSFLNTFQLIFQAFRHDRHWNEKKPYKRTNFRTL